MSAPPPLPGVFAALAPLLDSYGYLAVGGLLFLEDFGVPAPGETVLIAAAVYAGAGQLNIVVVVLVALLAAVAGDNVGYAIGRYGGRRVVVRFGRYVGLTATRVDSAERFFARHGGKIIVVARFVEGLRQANGIIAGISGMPWLRFLSFNVLGALLWVGVWTSLGDLAGTHIDQIYQALRRYELYLLAALAVLITGVIIYRARRRGERRACDASDDEPVAPGESGGGIRSGAPATPRATAPTGPGRVTLPRPVPTAAAVVVSMVVLALLWIGVATGTLLAALDPSVDRWLVAVRPSWLVAFARVVSEVGQPAVMIALLIVVAALVAARARSWVPAGISVGALLLLAVLDNGVKAVVARPRPPSAWHAMSAHGLAFPSGHALWSAGVLLLVVVLVGPCRGRRVLPVGGMLLVILVAASRVVLGVHYPSDLLAGWCLAVLADGLVLLAAIRLRPRDTTFHGDTADAPHGEPDR